MKSVQVWKDVMIFNGVFNTGLIEGETFEQALRPGMREAHQAEREYRPSYTGEIAQSPAWLILNE
jgi:hypothetical protein